MRCTVTILSTMRGKHILKLGMAIITLDTVGFNSIVDCNLHACVTVRLDRARVGDYRASLAIFSHFHFGNRFGRRNVCVCVFTMETMRFASATETDSNNPKCANGTHTHTHPEYRWKISMANGNNRQCKLPGASGRMVYGIKRTMKVALILEICNTTNFSMCIARNEGGGGRAIKASNSDHISAITL